jgi:hypothetical protein
MIKTFKRKQMKLENQVTSIEYSNKLKELGIEQTSLWYWDYNVYKNEHFKWDLILNKDLLGYKIDDYISAYTVAELGEMFPDQIKLYTQIFKGIMTNNISSVSIGFEGSIFLEETEANGRASVLIYLIENGLIKL